MSFNFFLYLYSRHSFYFHQVSVQDISILKLLTKLRLSIETNK